MKTELLKTVRRYPGEFYIGQGRGAWVQIWSKPRKIIREARKSLKKRQRRVRKYRAPRRAYYVGVLIRIRRARRLCRVFAI
jgi:hypothetical protein